MFDFFVQLDWSLFRLINVSGHVPMLDHFFMTITDLHKTDAARFVVLPLLVLGSFWWGRWQTLKGLLVLSFVVGACDFTNHRLVKPLVGRSRPFLVKEVGASLRLPYEPGGFSFPSNHAINSMAGVLVASAYVPPLGPILIPYAVMVGYSRPYLGVHFPSDIVFGWLLAWIIGYATIWFLRRKVPSWAPK